MFNPAETLASISGIFERGSRPQRPKLIVHDDKANIFYKGAWTSLALKKSDETLLTYDERRIIADILEEPHILKTVVTSRRSRPLGFLNHYTFTLYPPDQEYDHYTFDIEHAALLPSQRKPLEISPVFFAYSTNYTTQPNTLPHYGHSEQQRSYEAYYPQLEDETYITQPIEYTDFDDSEDYYDPYQEEEEPIPPQEQPYVPVVQALTSEGHVQYAPIDHVLTQPLSKKFLQQTPQLTALFSDEIFSSDDTSARTSTQLKKTASFFSDKQHAYVLSSPIANGETHQSQNLLHIVNHLQEVSEHASAYTKEPKALTDLHISSNTLEQLRAIAELAIQYGISQPSFIKQGYIPYTGFAREFVQAVFHAHELRLLGLKILQDGDVPAYTLRKMLTKNSNTLTHQPLSSPEQALQLVFEDLDACYASFDTLEQSSTNYEVGKTVTEYTDPISSSQQAPIIRRAA